MLGRALLLVLLPFQAVLASFFVPTPTGFESRPGHANTTVRFKRVPPHICHQNTHSKSYAGYVDLSEYEHMFFWFFEADEEPEKKPLTVWFNGGPGSSSMIGLFQENGPCTVMPDDKLRTNPYSWTRISNMLYIDQPVATGFSYSHVGPVIKNKAKATVEPLASAECPKNLTKHEVCGTYSLPKKTKAPSTTAECAPAVWKMLQGFIGAFPEYGKKKLHLTTESYGGHYAPAFGSYFLKQNEKNLSGTVPMDLDSIMIGNGWYDPLVHYEAYYNFTVHPGNTYDFQPFNKSISEKLYNNLHGEGKCLEQIRNCYATGDNRICRKADTFCANKVESVLDKYANRDDYDIRELMPDPFPYENFAKYLNTPKVQQAIGAYQNYSDSAPQNVISGFTRTGDDGRTAGSVRHVRHLLEKGVKITMHAGDADYNCNWFGGHVIAEKIGGEPFADSGYANLTVSNNTYGQVRQAGSLAFVRVYYSGHEVPFYQPSAALALLNRTIEGVDIASGQRKTAKDFHTVGPRISTFHQGNGTVQHKVLPPSATYNRTTHRPNLRQP